jgi:hypothetical protein
MPKVAIAFYAASQLNSFVKTNVIQDLCNSHDVKILSTNSLIAKALKKDFKITAEQALIPKLVRRISGFVQMVSLWKFRDRSMNHVVRAMASFGTKKDRKSWKCVVVSEMRISLWKRLTVRSMSLNPLFLILRSFERLLLQSLMMNRFRKSLKGVDLFLVPFSGHIGADFGDLVWVARQLKIPVVGLQENWDNLSTKTFILEEPDYFLVWGDQSAGHLRSVHRLFKTEVRTIGSPRFAPYYRNSGAIPTVSMEDGTKVELPEEQFILVAGTGDGIDDEMLVRLVASTISTTAKHENHKQRKIVYRPHPLTRTAVDCHRLQQDFENLLIDNGPEAGAFGHHNSLVASASLVINHFSTLTIESLICGTPVMVPLFLGRPDAMYRYEHILNEWHHMMGIGLISQIWKPRSPEEFSRQIIDILNEETIDLRKAVELDWICKKGDYVAEISEFIYSIC